MLSILPLDVLVWDMVSGIRLGRNKTTRTARSQSLTTAV